MQLNISLPDKFDKLKILIQRLREKKNIVVDCILLCETFLTETLLLIACYWVKPFFSLPSALESTSILH